MSQLSVWFAACNDYVQIQVTDRHGECVESDWIDCMTHEQAAETHAAALAQLMPHWP